MLTLLLAEICRSKYSGLCLEISPVTCWNLCFLSNYLSYLLRKFNSFRLWLMWMPLRWPNWSLTLRPECIFSDRKHKGNVPSSNHGSILEKLLTNCFISKITSTELPDRSNDWFFHARHALLIYPAIPQTTCWLYWLGAWSVYWTSLILFLIISLKTTRSYMGPRIKINALTLLFPQQHIKHPGFLIYQKGFTLFCYKNAIHR